MRLFIDTSNNQKTVVFFNGKRLERPTGVQKSQQVLFLIDKILKENKKSLRDLTEIEVETGANLPYGQQPSFTGLRVGLSVANALAWALKIPVNGRNVEKEGPLEPTYEVV